jgi:hypothetical protein
VKLYLTLTKIITIYFSGGLSWYVYDAAQIIATKVAKKPFNGIDRGDSLVFQEFIQSWVGYELVKVLNVFGLQPKIRSDLANWSPDLFATFTYLSNRTNNQHKDKATKTLDLLFDQTEHNSYFGKLNFGSKEKFKTLNNSSLYLLILTWLRQLEQYFYSFECDGDSSGDWNKYGKYYGTPSMLKAAPLANIYMAQANENRTPVTDVTFFEPDHRDGVCVSLEEWGAKIFTPYSTGKLRDAKSGCDKTKIRFKRSKKFKQVFSFTETDLSNKGMNNNNSGVQKSAGVATSYNSSPDRHQGQQKEMLLYNISCGIKLLLNKSEENSKKKGRKLKKGNRMITQSHKRLLHLCWH